MQYSFLRYSYIKQINMPTLNNYTYSNVTFSVVEGTELYDTRQTATIVLTPNPGFELFAEDFTRAPGPVPDGIENYEFVQDGANVNLILTFAAGFEMPSNNIDLLLCVEGSAKEKEFWTKWGWGAQPVANASWSFSGTSLSEFGTAGDTITVIYTTLTANPGSKLTSTNIVFDFPNENFAYTETKLYDVDGNWISSTFIVTYTFETNDFVPNTGGDGYYILLNGTAEEIFVEEPIITAYTVSTTNMPAYGGFINITIYGNPGAVFSLERNDGVSTELLLEDIEMTDYRYTYVAEIPSVTSNTEYEFVISGDLSDTFDTTQGQSSSFIVYQYLPITITFDATGTGLTGYSSTYRLYNALQQPIEGSSASHVDIMWEIESSTGADLEIIKEIENSDWSNLYVYSYDLTSDCNNSDTLILESTDNLVAGMDVNLGTPFSSIKIDTVVDSTTVIITEPITLLASNSVDFYSSNDNMVSMSTSLSLSSDSKIVTIIASIDILQYGYDNIDLVLNLDNIIAENAGTSCVEFFATTGLYPSTISYLDCSGNFQSFDMDPNQISPSVFGLSDSISFSGMDTIITLV